MLSPVSSWRLLVQVVSATFETLAQASGTHCKDAGAFDKCALLQACLSVFRARKELSDADGWHPSLRCVAKTWKGIGQTAQAMLKRLRRKRLTPGVPNTPVAKRLRIINAQHPPMPQ